MTSDIYKTTALTPYASVILSRRQPDRPFSHLIISTASLQDDGAHIPAESSSIYGEAAIAELRDFLNLHIPPTKID